MASESGTAHGLSTHLADAMPHIVWTHDASGNATYFNRKWIDYTGCDLARTIEAGTHSFVHPADREKVVAVFLAARTPGAEAEDIETTYRLRRHDGEWRWHTARVVPLRDASGRIVAFVGTAVDVDDQKRADQENHFLIEATKVLGSSLDVKKTLDDVARLVVPHLADWFAIDLLGENGKLERATVRHVDPEKVKLAWNLWERTPPRPDETTGPYAAMRTGKPQHFADIPDALLEQLVTDKEILAILRALGLRSSICVPLFVRERAIGALTLVAESESRRYVERDVAFAEEFARRVAMAIENANLYGEMTRARAAAEAVAAEVVEQSKTVEAALLQMRKERDDAIARARELEAKR